MSYQSHRNEHRILTKTRPTDWAYDIKILSTNQLANGDQTMVLGHLAGAFRYRVSGEILPDGRYRYDYQAVRFTILAMPGYELRWEHAQHCVTMMQKYYVRNPGQQLPGLVVNIYDTMYLAGMCQLGGAGMKTVTCGGPTTRDATTRLDEVTR